MAGDHAHHLIAYYDRDVMEMLPQEPPRDLWKWRICGHRLPHDEAVRNRTVPQAPQRLIELIDIAEPFPKQPPESLVRLRNLLLPREE